MKPNNSNKVVVTARNVFLSLRSGSPLRHLRKMMREDKPERRAYAVQVAGMPEDKRLQKDIRRLKNDQAKLGQFPSDWFWDTVGEAAEAAERKLKGIRWIAFLKKKGAAPVPWLKLTEPMAAEQGGIGQPATRSESKSEGGPKHQPKTEGRSR